jgi:hypothetical protein
MAEDDLARVLINVSSEGNVSREEHVQWLLIFRANMLGFEDTFFQHKHKLLDDEVFHSTVASMRRYFATPVWRASWKTTRSQYDDSFVAYVDRLVGEIAVAPPSDLFALWSAAVDAEKAAAVPSV